MGCRVIQTTAQYRPNIIPLVVLHKTYTKRRLNDSTAHGYRVEGHRLEDELRRWLVAGLVPLSETAPPLVVAW